jgi:GH15 family glucan-1,4-alpha-glucosidase
LLGLRQIPERFFDWCLDRAEDFKNTGLFYNAYSVNGSINGTLIHPADLKLPRKLKNKYIYTTHHGIQFQPDQNGSLLIAIGHHIKHFAIGDISKYKKLIEKSAAGISSSWKNKKFTLPYFDLWEERCILPSQRRYHIYSLAMCITGLRTAIELLGKRKNWLQTVKEMSNIFQNIYSRANLIPATYTKGKLAERREIKKDDSRSDTSLLGLVYPSAILDPFDSKMKKTIDKILEKNTMANGGLLRYPGDTYCGGIQKGRVTLTGAGAWPLLNFWMAIYFCLRKDSKNAEKYFNWPLERINKYIPEQIFKNKTKLSVCPLVWSHSMFIIAARFLGYI